MRSRSERVGSLAAAFKVGLKPIERDGHWLRPFDGMARYLSEKKALIARQKLDVFGDVGGTTAAQCEIYQLITRHLVGTFPHAYKWLKGDMLVSTDAQRFIVAAENEPPLLSASRMVGDDLVLMRQTAKGWCLSAGSVCFPSVWRLREKLGLVMAEVHAPVPGFHVGTRHAAMIERVFDHLPIGETVQRGNWSLHSVSELHLPHHDELDCAEIAKIFLRCETQTLTKLSSGNDILFTIGVSVDPLKAIEGHPAQTKELAAQLMALNDAELEYKGLSAVRERLHDHLTSLTGTA